MDIPSVFVLTTGGIQIPMGDIQIIHMHNVR